MGGVRSLFTKKLHSILHGAFSKEQFCQDRLSNLKQLVYLICSVSFSIPLGGNGGICCDPMYIYAIYVRSRVIKLFGETW